MPGDPLLETGFTPIIDVVAKELGLIPAAVYGVVRRHCQLSKGYCDASRRRMAKLLGVNNSTITRALKTLCKEGYIEDMTPDRTKATHLYRDTGEAKIRQLVDNKSDAQSIRLNQVDNKTDAQSIATDAESIKSDAESTTKRQRQKETIQETDYLETILQFETGQETIGQPDDFQKYFGYRDQFLDIYNQLTGEVIKVPALKAAIIDLAQQENADPEIWTKSITATIGHWSGHSRLPPLHRIIEVYHYGGDYENWYEHKYGKNGNKPTEERAVIK